jgi:hypothetical protein
MNWSIVATTTQVRAAILLELMTQGNYKFGEAPGGIMCKWNCLKIRFAFLELWEDRQKWPFLYTFILQVKRKVDIVSRKQISCTNSSNCI